MEDSTIQQDQLTLQEEGDENVNVGSTFNLDYILNIWHLLFLLNQAAAKAPYLKLDVDHAELSGLHRLGHLIQIVNKKVYETYNIGNENFFSIGSKAFSATDSIFDCLETIFNDPENSKEEADVIVAKLNKDNEAMTSAIDKLHENMTVIYEMLEKFGAAIMNYQNERANAQDKIKFYQKKLRAKKIAENKARTKYFEESTSWISRFFRKYFFNEGSNEIEIKPDRDARMERLLRILGNISSSTATFEHIDNCKIDLLELQAVLMEMDNSDKLVDLTLKFCRTLESINGNRDNYDIWVKAKSDLEGCYNNRNELYNNIRLQKNNKKLSRDEENQEPVKELMFEREEIQIELDIINVKIGNTFSLLDDKDDSKIKEIDAVLKQIGEVAISLRQLECRWGSVKSEIANIKNEITVNIKECIKEMERIANKHTSSIVPTDPHQNSHVQQQRQFSQVNKNQILKAVSNVANKNEQLFITTKAYDKQCKKFSDRICTLQTDIGKISSLTPEQQHAKIDAELQEDKNAIESFIKKERKISEKKIQKRKEKLSPILNNRELE